MFSIISRYIFAELIPPFAVNLLFFTFIFIMAKLLKIINLIVNYHAGIGAVGLIILYAMPQFMMFIFPMAIMMSVLLTLIRMSGDQEVVAMKAGGVSLYRLVTPVMVFCLAGCLLTFVMTLYGKPWSKYAVKQLTYRLAASSFDAALKERSFIGHINGLMIYISEMDIRDREMKDVFIEDARNPGLIVTIVAPNGKIYKDDDSRSIRLRLTNGVINQADPNSHSASHTQFGTYDLRLDLDELIGSPRIRKKEDEMYLGELIDYLDNFEGKQRRYHKALNELHIKFSVPFAALALGLIAIPLGLQLRSSKRSAGLGLGIAVFLAYYVLMTLGLVLGEKGKLHPAIGLWFPNVIACWAGMVFLHYTAKECPLPGSKILKGMLRRIDDSAQRFLARRHGAQKGSMSNPPST